MGELQSGRRHGVDPKIGDWEGGEVEEYNRAITASRFVTTGRTVVCVGRNYVEHAKELGRLKHPASTQFHFCPPRGGAWGCDRSATVQVYSRGDDGKDWGLHACP